MFSTGPANNCALEMYSLDSYATIATVRGMENIRRLELMLDLELLDMDSSSANMKIIADAITTNFVFIDVDYNGAVATPLSGLRFCVNRGSQKTATPGDTTPDFGKRMTLWLKDDQSTVTARLNGSSGTGVTYTAAEAASSIVSPTGPITIGTGGTPGIQMRLYEAAIRVNGNTVFHVRPRLYMADSATPETVPDLSGYGNDMHVFGTLNSTYRYIPSWSKEVPFAGKENAG